MLEQQAIKQVVRPGADVPAHLSTSDQCPLYSQYVSRYMQAVHEAVVLVSKLVQQCLCNSVA